MNQELYNNGNYFRCKPDKSTVFSSTEVMCSSNGKFPCNFEMDHNKARNFCATQDKACQEITYQKPSFRSSTKQVLFRNKSADINSRIKLFKVKMNESGNTYLEELFELSYQKRRADNAYDTDQYVVKIANDPICYQVIKNPISNAKTEGGRLVYDITIPTNVQNY
jgi:hypothetical protein